MINFCEILTQHGFDLRDCGDHWRSSAKFRGGDNPNSLQIFKDNGSWIDHARGTSLQPFEKLLQESNIDIKTISSNTSNDAEDVNKNTLKIAKTYEQSCLSRLLPHYNFYFNRGISEEILKLYRGGLATYGKMYQRFVFPIFRDDDKIIGFSGRDMMNGKDRPKWKHLGIKADWLYPYHMKDLNGNPTMNSSYVDFSKDVFLIESIGDSLSMSQFLTKAHFVTFGLKLSSKLMSNLIGLNPSRIIIALNNDQDNFAGLIGAVKMANSLYSVFSKSKIIIQPPIKNDFGEMRCENDYAEYSKMLANNFGYSQIQKYAQQLIQLNKIPKKSLTNI